MKKIVTLISLMIISLNVNAEPQRGVSEDATKSQYNDYKDQLCAKVKQCRLGSMVTGDAPDFMQELMVETLNSQCVYIASGYEAQIIQAKLEKKAKSCVSSLSDKSCESLHASNGESMTEQCDVFLESADKAGIDFSTIQF